MKTYFFLRQSNFLFFVLFFGGFICTMNTSWRCIKLFLFCEFAKNGNKMQPRTWPNPQLCVCYLLNIIANKFKGEKRRVRVWLFGFTETRIRFLDELEQCAMNTCEKIGQFDRIMKHYPHGLRHNFLFNSKVIKKALQFSTKYKLN